MTVYLTKLAELLKEKFVFDVFESSESFTCTVEDMNIYGDSTVCEEYASILYNLILELFFAAKSHVQLNFEEFTIRPGFAFVAIEESSMSVSTYEFHTIDAVKVVLIVRDSIRKEFADYLAKKLRRLLVVW